MTVGPQPWITAPAGAIPILPGQSIQEAINIAAGGAAFVLKAGVHTAREAIPRSGNTFVGEFGAILDGAGWVTADLDAAAFKALNVDVDHVTIRNLELRNMPQKAVMAYKDFSSGWVVDYCDLHHCKNGVELPGDSAVLHSKIHHNIGTPGHSNPAERGGGYSFNAISRITFSHNEVYENGAEQKWILCTHITCAGNHFHHNANAGPWIDGGGADSVLEDNICEENLGPGLYVEIASGVIVRRNRAVSNGEAGLLVSISQGCDVYENALELNLFGIDLFLDCDRLAEHYPPHPDPDLANNTFRDNAVIVGPGQLAVNFAIMGGCGAPYIANPNQKGLRFERNAYTVPDAGAYWIWGDGQKKTFPQWQALGFDTGAPVPPDPEPPEPTAVTCSLDGQTYPEGATSEVTIRRNRVSAWQGDHPEWVIISTKPHPKNKSQVMLTVQCRPS